jgi:hypothetical protein
VGGPARVKKNALKISDGAAVSINQNRGSKPKDGLKVLNPLASANASAVL